jgi:hypothetical protein
MLRSFLTRLFLCAAATCLYTLFASPVCATDKDDKKTKEYDEVKFDTVDQVEIHGRFYAGDKKKEGGHDFGAD